MPQEVTRCRKHESGVETPRKPIDRPGTNRNRVHRKTTACSESVEYMKSRTCLSCRRWSGGVDTNIGKTSREWRPLGRRQTTSR